MSEKTAIDPKAFRNALGSFTTGVTIITTVSPDGEPVGMTANSFNSVSLDPPMVLWSIARSARSLAAFEASEYWAVHILSDQQEALSNRFAKSGEDKFNGLPVQAGTGGIPLLDDCCARLQCKTAVRYDGGDHIIFVGEVLAFEHTDAPPLVFHAGKYALATRKPQPFRLPAERSSPDNVAFGEDFLGYLLARAHFQFYAQMREHLVQNGIDDTEYFALTLLSLKGGRSVEEINRRFSYTGYHITTQVTSALQARGLLSVDGEGTAATCELTDAGRNLTLRLIAAAKAIEDGIVEKIGQIEAASLKHLLKRLISETDPGLAHPWEN
ncbi:nitrilotriacetate monooxygenase [Pandoraea captiosa]|uniref:Nitrilotriacetate monooxygenase n=1 Tax=Pandoraea captiosa TaxID=2508302 RepID=A0A5E5A8T1_9BURK|nr:flavin reductase [Pandoraea captiosa]VVE70019.1 nitrilotriacetate monooxygenase [Pandoraea captiosa]